MSRWPTPLVRLAVCALLVILPGLAQASAETGESSEWLAIADSKLDNMRGGFSALPGVMVSFGILRTVHVNGVLTSQSGFQIADLRSISVAQAEQLSKQTGAMTLVQTGAGNLFDSGLKPGAPAIVIQNTLSNQKIQSLTEINATSNGMSLLKGLNTERTLSDALGAAARR